MFILANIVEALAYVLDTFLWIYFWIIIIRALISWVNPDPWNPVVQFLYRVTEPVLQPVRRYLLQPVLRYLPLTMGIDFSPVVVLIGIQVLRIAVVKSFYDLAVKMRW